MKILFVDDEPDLLTIGKIYLEKNHKDFKIITAESAKEAFNIIDAEDIDVIVSDYQMPVVNGLEFLQLVRANNQDIPFIIFTGRGREEIAIAALNFGADRYIQKGGKMEVQYGVLTQAIYQVYSHSQTKEALVDSEQRYRSLFQTSPDGIIIASLEGMINYANNGLLEMLGYSLGELRVLGISDISSEQFKKKLCVFNQEQLSNYGYTDEFDWEFMAKDGSTIPCSGKLWYETNIKSQPVHLMGIFRDKSSEIESDDIIKRKSEVEKLILQISTDLINCSTEDIGGHILNALRNVGIFSKSDHVYLNKITKDKRHMINVHLVSSGKVTTIDRFQPIEMRESTLNRLLNNEIIIVKSKEDLSQETLKEFDIIEIEKVNSRVSVPLMVKGELIGIIGYLSDTYEKEWNIEEINLLRSVGQILANTLDRGTREQELKESKKRYEQLTELLVEGVATVDQEGIIIYANNRVCEMLGYSLEELIGAKMTDLLPDNQRKRANEIFSSNDTSEPIYEKYESSVKKKDGSYLETSVSTQRIFNEEGNYLGSTLIITDKTELIEAERKLQMSEKRWEYAIDGSELGLWDWEIQTGKSFYSKKLKAMLGYEEHEIGTDIKEWSTRIHPDDYDRVMKENFQYLQGDTPIYQSEYRMRCKDGSYKWILARGKIIDRDEEGNPKRVIGLHMHIDEQKKLEELLKESEERWKFALEGSEQGVWDYIVVSDEVFYSDRWKKLYGYEPEEIGTSNKEWSSRIHPDDY
ncbi:MAG: PAS domain S-box protein, partial [Candidatus Heimdallarchaeota archaeon]|nr:PAS domain S-box protein [Candidatus Heimdallarchaeota archaeon]MCK5048540.1 PAS domain S-box protein [Candidatus Heimdallarchaeota archaeon]